MQNVENPSFRGHQRQLESFSTGCWAGIINKFAIETVDECVKETLNSDPDNPQHIVVSRTALQAGLAHQHPVTRKELATLAVNHPQSNTLDDGEKHLLAWLLANKALLSQSFYVTTADKAALVASNEIGLLDCMISLESLADKAGVGRSNLKKLKSQYCENWLSDIRNKIKLCIIP